MTNLANPTSAANTNNQIHFTEEQVSKLMQMQDELNTYIHPQWKEQVFDWDFAIIDECREIKEHLGWKWWKDNYNCGLTEENKKQVQLEVIDILHFILSNLIDCRIVPERVTSWLNNNAGYYFGALEASVTCLIREVAAEDTAVPEIWNCLAHNVGLTTETIIETYTQKYVLNKFRQDNGYKEGTYQKVWLLPVSEYNGGTESYEDNEVLQKIAELYKQSEEDLSDEKRLYRRLTYWYERRMNK